MSAPRLTVATWNLEWKAPGSTAARIMVERLAGFMPHIVCLTEVYAHTPLGVGHVIEAEPNYGYRLVEGRRKVLLWSREPWQEIDRIGDLALPSGRFVSGRTQTPLGLMTIVGVCVPWRDAHVRTGRRDRAPWQDHLAYLESLRRALSRHTGQVIVLGDFNQYVPGRRAPLEVERALSCAFGDKFKIATGGELEPLGHTVIDHIACNSGLQLRFRTILSNRSLSGEPLSDHYGVVTSFVSTGAAEAASAALVQPRPR